jgi:hypothetical protein
MTQLPVSAIAFDLHPIDPEVEPEDCRCPGCHVYFKIEKIWWGVTLKVQRCRFATIPAEALMPQSRIRRHHSLRYHFEVSDWSTVFFGPGETTEYLHNKPLIIYQQYLFHMQYSGKRVLLLSGLRGKDKSTE